MKDSFQAKCFDRYFANRHKYDLPEPHEGWLNLVNISTDENKSFINGIFACLTQMRVSYTDSLIMEYEEPIGTELDGVKGKITYVQSVREDDCYQTEVHYDLDNGTMRQFVLFLPELADTIALYDRFIKRELPDLDAWDEITDFIFTDEGDKDEENDNEDDDSDN
ncbi:MAG: hypothetical protein IJ080_01690 [Oscillospiraceae bacterium]|nr:hypothetical protein [Oscillospiraceae bacterium]MBQ8978455.1 hypothetical protein [Oscillospiraceae bacterium]